jgi:hypothetical protein
MGLLDDAIREHLDLKRRRGADPTEVERLEQEALGPVRRPGQPSEDVVFEDEVLDHQNGEATVFDDHGGEAYPETEVAHPQEPSSGEPVERPPVFDQEPEPFPVDESEQRSTSEPTERWEVEEPVAAEDPSAPVAETPPPSPPPATPPPAPAEPAREHADHPGGETVEYDVEAEEMKKHDGEDVLEETPEFLQDTPDHDRLWFEQRPPKDFDFEG